MKFILILFMLFVSLPVYADDQHETLKQIEERMAAEKSKQVELSTKMQSLEKDMKGLKTDLIDTANKVQKHEKNLSQLEDKIEDLTAQKKTITDNLNKDRQSLADLVTALERIRRLPPEALIARPGAPLETAQASVILGAIMPELNKRADDYRKKLDALQKIEDDLTQNREQLKNTAEKLKGSQKQMEGLISQRQGTLEQAKSDYQSQQQEVATLSSKASDLRDLIRKIEEKRAHEEKSKKTEALPGKQRKNKVEESELGGSLASLGSGKLPVPGVIAIKYGQQDDLGAPSEGLHIKARPGSVVVAPLKGVVRYAGPFKSYGSLSCLSSTKIITTALLQV